MIDTCSKRLHNTFAKMHFSELINVFSMVIARATNPYVERNANLK